MGKKIPKTAEWKSTARNKPRRHRRKDPNRVYEPNAGDMVIEDFEPYDDVALLPSVGAPPPPYNREKAVAELKEAMDELERQGKLMGWEEIAAMYGFKHYPAPKYVGTKYNEIPTIIDHGDDEEEEEVKAPVDAPKEIPSGQKKRYYQDGARNPSDVDLDQRETVHNFIKNSTFEPSSEQEKIVDSMNALGRTYKDRDRRLKTGSYPLKSVDEEKLMKKGIEAGTILRYVYVLF